MATTLTNKIIKVIVDSKGVKPGVDDAVRQLNRLESATEKANRSFEIGASDELTSRRDFLSGAINRTYNRIIQREQLLQKLAAGVNTSKGRAAGSRETFERIEKDIENDAKFLEQLRGEFAGINKVFAGIANYNKLLREQARSLSRAGQIADLEKRNPLLTRLSELGASFDEVQRFRDPAIPLRKLEDAIRKRIKAQFDEIERIKTGIELGNEFRASTAAAKTLAGVGPNPVFRDIRFSGSKAEKAVEALIAGTAGLYERLSGVVTRPVATITNLAKGTLVGLRAGLSSLNDIGKSLARGVGGNSVARFINNEIIQVLRKAKFSDIFAEKDVERVRSLGRNALTVLKASVSAIGDIGREIFVGVRGPAAVGAVRTFAKDFATGFATVPKEIFTVIRGVLTNEETRLGQNFNAGYKRISEGFSSAIQKASEFLQSGFTGKIITGLKGFGSKINDGLVIAKESASRLFEAAKSTRLGRIATSVGGGISNLAGRGLRAIGLGGDPNDPNSPSLVSRLFGGAASLATKAVGIVGGALAKVGGFVLTEFVNFVSRVAANLTSRLIAAGVEGLAALSLKAIDAAKKYEDAITSFGVLAGGQTRGTQLVDQLQKLAIDTPFKFAEVLDQSKLLLSYGVSVNDLTKRLRQLGDVASGTGVDLGRLSLAFGQVLAKGRLQGPEIRQFTEAGVGIRDFVAAFNELEGRNVSTQGFLSLVEAGDVSAKVVERAFDKMTSAGGRFFNFMEVRSKTVSGRLSALGESFELVLQKIGKSIFDKFNVAGVIDDLVKKLGGIDFKAVDAGIGRFAEQAVPFGRGVAGGFGGVLEALKRVIAGILPDQNGLRDNFRFLGEVVIPGVIKVTQVLGQLFLKLTSIVASFADVMVQAIEVLYPLTLRPLVGFLKGIGLANNGQNRPLLAIRDLANRADNELQKEDLGKAFADIFAIDNLGLKEAQKIVAEEDRKRAIGIPQVVPDNDRIKKAKELVRIENERIAKIKRENAAIAQGLNDRIQAAFNRDRFVAARDNPFRIAFDKADGFAPLGVTPRDVKGEDIAKFNAILQGDIRGLAEQVTGGAGVAKLFESATGIAIPKNLEEFNNNLKEAAFKGIPNFNQRLEEISKLGEKTKDPVAEFKRNLDTINRADTDFARRGGFGLEPEAARRARGQLARQFIEQFKPPEIQPAPLVRAASQEAEQALTRAIYENRNNGKTPEAELQGAIEQAEQTTKELNTNIDRLATATEAIVPKLNNGGGNFFAIGFGL